VTATFTKKMTVKITIFRRQVLFGYSYQRDFNCDKKIVKATKMIVISTDSVVVCAVGHKSHDDPCFYKKYPEAWVITFVAQCTRTQLDFFGTNIWYCDKVIFLRVFNRNHLVLIKFHSFLSHIFLGGNVDYGFLNYKLESLEAT